MNYIFNFLSKYFDSWQNRIFWGLILLFCIGEKINKVWKKRNYIKIWLKDHNIGKKYK